MEIKYAKLFSDAKAPTRKHLTDAGLDFYILDTVSIHPHTSYTAHTGITVEIPEGYFMLMKPKGKADFLVGAGVVDEGYQGEILVKIVNISDQYCTIYAGEAIVQGVLIPTIYPIPVEYKEIHSEKTDRGATGGIMSSLSHVDIVDGEVLDDFYKYGVL
jgi:dUTP pyrophosphatase